MTMHTDRLPLINVAGHWRHGSGSTVLNLTNPATAQAFAQYQAAGQGDIAEALQATQTGFAQWRQRTALERSDILRRTAALLRKRANDIATALTREEGKPLLEANREVEQAAQMVEWNAEEGRRVAGENIPTRMPNTRFATLREPIGPVAAFTPWNFPVMLSAMKVSAALAAGCSVILKPAEETPTSAAAMVRCFHEAGVPGEALQMLVGAPAEISQALIASDVIRKVSFTGSTQVGRLLAEQAGRALKPITLELGGHAPVVVCEDADPDAVVATLSQIKLRNAGQICANPSRFYVHRKHYESFIEAFAAIAKATVVGSGEESSTTMGPLANERRQKAVQALVDDACQQGARLVCGGQACDSQGNGLGFFYLPTVLADVPLSAKVMQQEPFGPLIPVVPFDTVNEALAMANGLPVGLAAFVFTNNLHQARHLSENLRAGAVGINCITLMQPETPFGGVQQSGFGRENGRQTLDAFLVTRSVVTAC
jgi:succinate-semialdehyde dehydrogenase/glutarate-semialdehyde dehydrogenase